MGEVKFLMKNLVVWEEVCSFAAVFVEFGISNTATSHKIRLINSLPKSKYTTN
ncbi:MAG: hypothetical protein K1X26_07805 [Chitinophagales bacterium]|nr:hypothetical protein [Chitinophagales bacterium]